MATLLKVDSSPMGQFSVSRKLTAKFLESWLTTHPGGKVITRDLSDTDLPVVDHVWVAAVYTPEEARTLEQKTLLDLSDSLVDELLEADEFVFGVPMHNFSIPSSLKLWIDQIARVGKTFTYSANGPVGLLSGKKATLLLASGGSYGEGTALASLNFLTPYLQTVFGFIGVKDVTIIAAEGTAQLRTGSVDPQTFLAPYLERVHVQASL